MDWQSPQCAHLRQIPKLPSFSQLMLTIGQPSDPSPEEQAGGSHALHTRDKESRNMSHSPSPSSDPRRDALNSSPTGQLPIFYRRIESLTSRETPSPRRSEAVSDDSGERLSGGAVTNECGLCVSSGQEGEEIPLTRLTKRRRKDSNQPMDPHFTRDGNPRKRLAQACNRCRAQHTKCVLRGPACVLCQKQGFECKFTAQTYQRAPKLNELSAIQWCNNPQTGDISPGAYNPKKVSVCRVSEEEAYRTLFGTSQTHSRSLMDMRKVEIGSSPDGHESVKAPSPNVSEEMSCDSDPCLFQADLTQHYVECYFAHLNQSPFYLLPRTSFIQWTAVSEKGLTEKILLYAIMAAGAAFSNHKHRDSHRNSFTSIARDGLKRCSITSELSVVHTWLVMSAASCHYGDLESARNDSVAALRCAYDLQLNEDRAYHSDHSQACYLTNAQARECCRRTFWLAYLGTSAWAFFPESLSRTPALNGTLRLPSSDAEYEAGHLNLDTLIDLHGSDNSAYVLLRHCRLSRSQMSLLIEASLIVRRIEEENAADDLTDDIWYQNHTLNPQPTIEDNIRSWRCRRDEIQTTSLETMSQELRLMDKWITIIHRRYPNRNFYNSLDPAQVSDHYRNTRQAARQLLGSLDQVQGPTSTSPFTSYAVLVAFDTITAAGRLSSVLDYRDKDSSGKPTFMSLATHAITIMSHVAEYSKLAKMRLSPMKKRLATIMTQSNCAEAWRKSVFCFTEPLCESLRRSGDVVYGMTTERMVGLFGLAPGEDEILVMR